MKLYLLTAEPFHDGSTVLGIFSSTEKAITAVGGLEFKHDDFYNCLRHKLPPGSYHDWGMTEDLLLREYEVDVYHPYGECW